jgi:undecaprenyl-diphosphatase
VLGANLLSLKDAVEAGISWGEVPVYLAGVLVAAVVGYACIRLLKMVADKGRFGFFAYYCWIVGVLTLILTLVQN